MIIMIKQRKIPTLIAAMASVESRSFEAIGIADGLVLSDALLEIAEGFADVVVDVVNGFINALVEVVDVWIVDRKFINGVVKTLLETLKISPVKR